MTSEEPAVYEIVHTVITVIVGAHCAEDAETWARRMLETRPVDPFSITEGADVLRVDIAPPAMPRNCVGQRTVPRV